MKKFNQSSKINLIPHYQRNKQPPGRARSASSAAAAHGVNWYFRVKGPNWTTNTQLFKYHHYFWLLTFWFFFFFSFPALTTTHIFLPLMASKLQDLFFWFVLCSKYSQPLQLCARRGGAAVPAQNCVLCWLPVQKKELFSHLPALPCGMKPSDTWCSYLCSAGERQEDVAEGPRGFPCHFCLSGPAGGLRWGDLCPAGCCWLWSPGRWLLAVRVSHWHCCSCGWYLSRRDTKVGGVGHRRCFMPWENQKRVTRVD